MSNSIWLIMYDVATRDEVQYLDWFHGVHIPEKLARPGYNWAAHYEIITVDGQPALLNGAIASGASRGFIAFFGGADTRTFLNPSPAQIKPTQPQLTQEMMGLRIGSKSLIAAEEWRIGSQSDANPDYAFLDVAICDTGINDEDYGAWCIQSLCPDLLSSPGFEVATKMLSTTTAAKHITVASFRSLADIQAYRASAPDDEWSKRVRDEQRHGNGSPMLGRRIWPVA